MGAFKKLKRPGPLRITDKLAFSVAEPGSSLVSVRLGFGDEQLGPRAAVKIARWLERYAKWSSLK